MKCPRCRKDNLKIIDLSRGFKRVLEREYVICSCGKGMFYEELLDHVHICAKKEIECPLGCGESVTLESYKKHFDTECKKVLV